MLILSEKLINTPVMSLQTGAELAKTETAIIDPSTLTIIAYTLVGPCLENSEMLLFVDDIREISSMGLIINSSDDFLHTEDAIKLKELIALHFSPIGLDVIDEKKNKLGKIYTYTVTPDFTIHQLFVKRSLFRSLQTSELIINRTQIIEINNKHVIVNSATLEDKPKPAAMSESFVNPFRQQNSPSANSVDQN